MNEPRVFEAPRGPAPRTGTASGKSPDLIRFRFISSTLAPMLLAASEKGLCALSLGEDQDELFCDLRRKFPVAKLSPAGDADFHRLADQVTGFIDGSPETTGIPLDIRGTDFQKQVWQALRAIPLGKKVSYADIAARIGSPKAVRAVAGACAANKIAIFIPCHRVVRGDGSLSGFRWGVELKRRLLEREAGS